MKSLAMLLLLLIAGQFSALGQLKGTYYPDQRQFRCENDSIWVGLFEDGIASYYHRGYVGLVDTTGVILCTAKYHFIEQFVGDLAIARNGYESGLIDLRGNEIVPVGFNEITFQENGLVYVKSEYRTRVFTPEGMVLSDYSYDFLGPFEEDRATFVRENRFGWITPLGEEIVLLKEDSFEAIQRIYAIHHGAILNDANGNRIDDLFALRDGLAVSVKEREGEVYYGCVDKFGKERIRFEYETIKSPMYGLIVAQKTGKWGVLEQRGHELLPFEFEEISIIDATHFIVQKEGVFYAVDKNNQLVQGTESGSSVEAQEKLHLRKYKNAKLKKYDVLFPLTPNLLRTHDGKKWGVVDSTGSVILDFNYDGIAWDEENQIGIASIPGFSYSLNTGVPRYHYSGTFHFFDAEGKLDEHAFGFGKTITYIADYHDESYVLLNPDLYLPTTYQQELRIVRSTTPDPPEFLLQINDYFSIVGNYREAPKFTIKGGYPAFKLGIQMAKNEWIVPMDYDKITFEKYDSRFRYFSLPQNVLIIEKEGKTGAVNLFGEIVIPCKYRFLSFYGGVIEAGSSAYDENNNEYYRSTLFDLNGNVLIETVDQEYGHSLTEKWFGLN